MKPNKIYLLAHDLAFLSSKDAKPILYNCDISIVDVLGGQTPYILESEHNRLVDELKAENEKLTRENIRLELQINICPYDHRLEINPTEK